MKKFRLLVSFWHKMHVNWNEVGRQSASKLMEAAELLGAALSDTDAKAKTLEAVSNAAATNLEQLLETFTGGGHQCS